MKTRTILFHRKNLQMLKKDGNKPGKLIQIQTQLFFLSLLQGVLAKRSWEGGMEGAKRGSKPPFVPSPQAQATALKLTTL